MKRRCYDLQAREFSISLGQTTKIMAIMNCTPDSFSKDGLLRSQVRNSNTLLRHALNLIDEGADIVDIGGESTRPGAKSVSIDEELRRVIPLIEALVGSSSVPVSIDTSKGPVARAALKAGASIVNNVMGTKLSKGLLKAVCDFDAAIVLMHSRGTPRSMHRYTGYKNVMQEVEDELQLSVQKCLDFGIKKDRIILDPGIGFAKTTDANLQLIDELSSLSKLKFPILLGTSRKSFIGKVLNSEIEERLMGTAASVAAGIMRGAHIVRVHDVKSMKDVATMTDAIIQHHA